MFEIDGRHQHIFYSWKHRKQLQWPQQTSMLATVKHKCFEYLFGDYDQKWQRRFFDLEQFIYNLPFCHMVSLHWFYHVSQRGTRKKSLSQKCQGCTSTLGLFVDFEVRRETRSLLKCFIVFVTLFSVVNLNLSFISKGHEDSSLASSAIVSDKWSVLKWRWFYQRLLRSRNRFSRLKAFFLQNRAIIVLNTISFGSWETFRKKING